MKKQKIISIAGFAGVGKSLFCELLQEELSFLGFTSSVFAFANELKKDCQKRFFDSMGVDIFTCSREVKESVRYILVEEAEKNRTLDPDYYVKLLDNTISGCGHLDYILLADNRFRNELDWVQKNGGYVVYINTYETVGDKKIWVEAANQNELENTAPLEEYSDFYITWEKKNSVQAARHTVKNFIKYLQNHNLL